MTLENSGMPNTNKMASEKEKVAKQIFYDHIVPLARESFEHDGSLSSMVFLFLDDGSEDKVAITPMPAQMFMETEDKKEVLAEILKEFTNVIDIVAIGMFAEAWATKVNTNTNETSEKDEIIFYSFESENQVYILRDTVVRKDSLKKPELLHGKIQEDLELQGRFTGFLKDMKKIKLN